MQEIQKRFAYANQNFGWAGIKGYTTDMGRICIKYGIPDDVGMHNAEMNTLPYEIWNYSENRGYTFVFGDLQGNGRYILLHSNREGEVSNTDWKNLVQK